MAADIRQSRKAAKPEAAKPSPSSPPNRPNFSREIPFICALLGILVWAVFGQTLHHDFVNFDDDSYVYENPVVQQGLTAHGFAWAFTHPVAANWHPLPMLSHMLDSQLYGMNAGGHHLTSVLLHAATAMLLFWGLRPITNTIWPAAFVAAVFAVHPLRAESVAWISERKDVLSGLFFALTIIAYVRYARGAFSPGRYVTVATLFALGLMSKPMLVTLPFLLLLLDYWPLRRISEFQPSSSVASVSGTPKPFKKLLLEKVPFFLMSAAICVATLRTQDVALRAAEAIPLSLRFGNAVVSVLLYVWEFFYPVRLAAFYPYPANGWAASMVAGAALLLALITAMAFYWRKERPYLLVGWLWYCGTLLPVIGLVQVGSQAHADRYTYLPQIGLAIALVGLVMNLMAKGQNRGLLPGLGGGVILAALVATAHAQTAHWRNSESLWRHALDCTTNNAVAESNLANYLLRQNRIDEAITHAKAAIEIKPDYADARNCLGFALYQSGQAADAVPQFQEALKARPGFAAAHNNYGLVLLQLGRLNEAITELQAAVKSQDNLIDAHCNLGVALLQFGQPESAVLEYQKAIYLNPNYLNANNNLAWLFATCPKAEVRNGQRAIVLAEHANELSRGDNLMILRTLAAAYAEGGKFPQALATAQKASQMAVAQNRTAWAKALRADLELYQAGQPVRDLSH